MSGKEEKLQELSKEELVEIILSQGEEIESLKAKLRQYDNAHTPSSKKRFKGSTKNKGSGGKGSREGSSDGGSEEKETSSEGKRFPGREEGHVGAGINVPEADRTEDHTIDKEGYEEVEGGTRTKHVIDMPDEPIRVTKHRIHVYKDPDGNIVEPKVDLPEGFYGKNLQSFFALLEGKAGASHEKTRDLIRAIRPDLTLSTATIQNKIDQIAEALDPVREETLEKIREHKYCHADETGFRQDGINGWVWGFCTPEHAVYETDLSRSGDVVERMLGEEYDNILVVDGWQGYNGYGKQRCWAHLLREAEDLVEDNEEIQPQYERLCRMYREAKEMKEGPPEEREKFVKEKTDGLLGLDFMVKTLSSIPEARDFATKLENAKSHLFTGVLDPEIPLTNNHAERMVRKVVLQRKLMGCIRNEKGQKFIENVMSALQTWKLQGKNQFEQLKKFAG